MARAGRSGDIPAQSDYLVQRDRKGTNRTMPSIIRIPVGTAPFGKQRYKNLYQCEAFKGCKFAHESPNTTRGHEAVHRSCNCFFCSKGESHPERHESFHEVSGHLLVAESLNPDDVVRVEACGTCGHQRPMSV